MALAVVMGKRRRVGKEIRFAYSCAFDASYPSGGEALPATGRGDGWNGKNVKRVTGVPDATHFYLYDSVNDKLAAWTAGAEVGNGTNLSTKSKVPVYVFNRI